VKDEIADEKRRMVSEALRSMLAGRLGILEGRTRCADCGTDHDLTPGGPSDRIVIRCADCWPWARIKQRRDAIRGR
jgi:hypothetical protein